MDTDKTTFFSTIEPTRLGHMLASWKHRFVAPGALALVAETSRDLVPDLQKGFMETGVPLVGAIFPELLLGGEFQREGVILLRLDNMPRYCLISEIPQDEVEANDRIDALVEQLYGTSGNIDQDSTLFMIFDGMLPNIATLLDKTYLALADQVHYVGVNAGSETFQPMPCLFDQQHLVGNGVLAMALTDQPCARLDHGYQACEHSLMATATEGNKITTIDWRAAFEVYSELVAKQYHVTITPENFYQYGVHFPFGILRMEGDYLVRIPVALTDDGALFCVGEIPRNAMLTLLSAIPPGSSSSIDKLTPLPSHCDTPFVLGFYCAGRRLHLGDAAKDELGRWSSRLQPRPLFGALSLGEIGNDRTGGYPVFQNACLVSLPWK